MVERAELDPTMEEIVVALRETKRGAARPLPFTVVDGHAGGNWAASDATSYDRETGEARSHGADAADGSTDIANLRDNEIERLLTENARLNERVVFLLKVIERRQGRSIQPTANHGANENDHGAIFHDVKAALEAELRPVLLALVRLLEKQRAAANEEGVHRGAPEARRLATPLGMPSNWADRTSDAERELRSRMTVATGTVPPQSNLRQRMTRILNILRL